MMKHTWVFLFLLLLSGCQPGADPATPGRAYLDEVVDVLQGSYAKKNDVDWESFRTLVQQKGSGATTIEGTYDAIALALNTLADRGGAMYLAANGDTIYSSIQHCQSSSPDITIPDNIAYVRIQPFEGSPEGGLQYASEIQDQIKTEDSPALKGWVIDLRGNNHGDLGLLLAGLGPLLGNGICGYFIDPDGNQLPWSYEKGVSYINSVQQFAIPSYFEAVSANTKIAVIADPGTSGAAEGLMIAFIGKTNVRTFGYSPTCGVTTRTSVFELSDHAHLQFSTSLMADRNRRTYDGPITPDDSGYGGQNGAAQAALDWINN